MKKKLLSFLNGISQRQLILVAGFSFIILTTAIFFVLSNRIKSVETEVTTLPETGGNVVRIFVTREQYTGNLGGVAGANAKCASVASAAGLSGNWKALIGSSSQNVRDVLPDGKYVRLDDVTIADNKADLFDGTLDNPINIDQNKRAWSNAVWTGSNESGDYVVSRACEDWRSSDKTILGIRGDCASASKTWIDNGIRFCDGKPSLYCFENIDIDTDGDGSLDSADCAPNDSSIYPGAKEKCDNKDNDCDGKKDENLNKSCGTNTGECTKGSQKCTNGVWSSCTDIKPSTEVCDSKDNDCDGTVDEGCECTTGQTKTCGSSVGACSSGTQTCSNGAWSSCSSVDEGVVEVCDGIDNDCDGEVDEGLTKECGSNVGTCTSGVRTCEDGVWQECNGGVEATDEVCDEKDNDCDGTVDEGCGCTSGETQSCGLDVGECSPGVQTCEGEVWSECSGGVFQAVEVCDTLDNDCDGDVDEELNCEEERAEDEREMSEDSVDSISSTTDNNPLLILGIAAAFSLVVVGSLFGIFALLIGRLRR